MNVASQYRRNSVSGKSNTGLVVLLYDRLICTLFAAMAAIEAGCIEARGKEMGHAIRILGHLQATLDFAAGGDVAESLNKFYAMAMFQIVRISALQEIDSLKQLIAQVAAISEAWREVERQEVHPRSSAGYQINSRVNTG
ncbi:MAG: flagellar export chaperone FliS [Acidobacteriaceae bacterium]